MTYKQKLLNCTWPQSPVINSKIERYMSFTKPKKSLIEGKSVPDLRKLYKALACDVSVETTERELIEEFIKCKKYLE